MVLGKSPPGEFPPEKLPSKCHLENFPIPGNLPPRKFSPGIFPPISLILSSLNSSF